MLHSPKLLTRIHRKRHKKPEHLLITISSVIYPLTTVPQIHEVFANKSAENISLFTYLAYLFFTFVFLGYGINQKLRPIIVLQVLWLIMYILMLTGILLYS